MSVDPRFTEPWKDFARRWDTLCAPPIRPSAAVVDQFRRMLETANPSRQRFNVLLYGATPELRDLCSELGHALTLIDVNEEMIKAMTELCKRTNPGEQRLVADWRSMPVETGAFDIALGDLVISNLPLSEQPAFLRETHRILRPGGRWIARVAVQPANWRPMTFDAIVALYADGKGGRQLAQEFFTYLLLAAWDPVTGVCDCRSIERWMTRWREGDAFHHPSPIISAYLRDIWAMWRPLDKSWSWLPVDDTKRHFGSHFSVDETVVVPESRQRVVDAFFPLWSCGRLGA